MKVLVIRHVREDCEISMFNGYDLIVIIVPLFRAVVYPVKKGIQDIVDHLGWESAQFSSPVSFSFFPITELEMIARLEKVFKDLEIFVTVKYPLI